MRFALTAIAAFLIVGHVGSVRAETRTVPDSRPQIQLSFAPVVKHVAPAVVNVYAPGSTSGSATPTPRSSSAGFSARARRARRRIVASARWAPA